MFYFVLIQPLKRKKYKLLLMFISLRSNSQRTPKRPGLAPDLPPRLFRHATGMPPTTCLQYAENMVISEQKNIHLWIQCAFLLFSKDPQKIATMSDFCFYICIYAKCFVPLHAVLYYAC